MPKFAPNTGFKMPGVGSRNIDSPGNFRDEQHVDKMGYCDTTEDRMLPEGSSPLKARYTTTGYRKDIKELDLPQGAPAKEDEVYEKTETIENPPAEKPIKKDERTSDQVSYGMDTTPDKTVLGSETGNTNVKTSAAYDKLQKGDNGEALAYKGFKGGPLEAFDKYVKNYWANENATMVDGAKTYGKSENGGDRVDILKDEYDKLDKLYNPKKS